jgi:putative hydrolase of the HAD superfamily
MITNNNKYIFIFDLDDTLFPTSSISENIGYPLLLSLKNANKNNLYNEKKIQKIYKDCWKYPLDEVVKIHNLPIHFKNQLNEAYSNLVIDHSIELYSDAKIIYNLNFPKILVTTGYRKLQESKIEKLGLNKLFEKILIDDLYSDIRINKKKFFSDLINEFPSYNLIIIGDNLNSEIKFGNQLLI